MATNTHLLSSSFTLISQTKFPLVGCIRSVHFCMGPLWWWLCCKQILAFLISCLIVAEVILYLVLKFYWLFFFWSVGQPVTVSVVLAFANIPVLYVVWVWPAIKQLLNLLWRTIKYISCNCRLELPWINIMPCFYFNYWSLIFCLIFPLSFAFLPESKLLLFNYKGVCFIYTASCCTFIMQQTSAHEKCQSGGWKALKCQSDCFKVFSASLQLYNFMS